MSDQARNSQSGIITAAVVCAVIFVIGGFVAWRTILDTETPRTSEPEALPKAVLGSPEPEPARHSEPAVATGTVQGTPPLPEERPIIADPWPAQSIAAPNLEFQQGEPTWETEMKVILRSRIAPVEQARRLLAKLPTAPPEAYSALVENAVTRLPDSEYDAVALPVLLDSQTNAAALIALHADLLERPDPIALPALLKMAQTPNHPLAPSALETLALLVGADHGSDWAKWRMAVGTALQGAQQQ